MNKILNKCKTIAKYGFKYGKLIGIIWLGSFIVVGSLVFMYYGWVVLLAYIGCKLTGVCPI